MTLNDVKKPMALYNLIRRRRRHDVIDAVPLLAEKLRVNVFPVSRKTACKCFSCFNFSAYIRFFVNVLIKMNVNISNELNFSEVYRSVNYIGSLRGSFTLHSTQCSLHFDKHQKNEIHSSIICRSLETLYTFCISLVVQYHERTRKYGGNTNFSICAVDGADILPHMQKWLSTELIESRIISVDSQ